MQNGKLVKVRPTTTKVPPAVDVKTFQKITNPGDTTSSWSDTRAAKASRHINTGLDEPVSDKRLGKSKKDTKRWCKGKEGVEHEFKEVPVVNFNDKCFTKERCGHWRHYETKCVGCGKSSWRQYRAPDDYSIDADIEMADEFCNDGHEFEWETVPSEYGNPKRDGSKVLIRETCTSCGYSDGKYKKVSEQNARKRGVAVDLTQYDEPKPTRTFPWR